MESDDVLRERVKALMARIADSTAQRDEALKKAETLASSSDAVEQTMTVLQDATGPRLSEAAEAAAGVAARVQGAVAIATGPHQRVKAMDELLARAQAALKVVESVATQQQSLSKVDVALAGDDLEDAVECVAQFDRVDRKYLALAPAAQQQTSGRSTPLETGSSTLDDTSFDSSRPSDPRGEEHMEAARQQLHDRIEADLEAARHFVEPERRAAEVRRLTGMYARLSFVEQGCSEYTKWATEETDAELSALVQKELDTVDAAGGSHLAATSKVLDHLVASLEQHEAFMLEAFERVTPMLLALHTTGTTHCVTVLDDFLSKRRLSSRPPGASPKQGRSVAASSSPRQLDQTLEDMGHLLSCCQIYMHFMEDKLAKEATAKGETAVRLGDSPLFLKLQDLLGIFIPLQVEYFDSSFAVAVTEAEEQLKQAGQELKQLASRAAAGKPAPDGAAAGFMSALGALYTQTNVEPSIAELTAADVPDIPLTLTLVDDIFYLCRIALHRALGTRVVSIASSSLIAINDLVRDQLLPELVKRVTVITGRDGPSAVPLLSLRWLDALAKASQYTTRTAEECGRLASSGFTGQDLLRLNEQKLDFVATARQADEALAAQQQRLGNNLASSMTAEAVAEFAAFSHVVGSEQAYTQSDLVDSWMRSAAIKWQASLRVLQRQVSESVFERLVVHIVERVVADVEAAVWRKRFDAFGALLLDRDIRALRAFFAEWTELPLREKFARLNAVGAVLLVDSPAEAASAVSPGVLEDAEVTRAVRLRVEFAQPTPAAR